MPKNFMEHDMFKGSGTCWICSISWLNPNGFFSKVLKRLEKSSLSTKLDSICCILSSCHGNMHQVRLIIPSNTMDHGLRHSLHLQERNGRFPWAKAGKNRGIHFRCGMTVCNTPYTWRITPLSKWLVKGVTRHL